MASHRMHLVIAPDLLARLDAEAERDRPGAPNRSATAIRILAHALAPAGKPKPPAKPPKPAPAPAAVPLPAPAGAPRRIVWPGSPSAARHAFEHREPVIVEDDGPDMLVVEVEAAEQGQPLYVKVTPLRPTGR